jgi:hypothetical protein
MPDTADVAVKYDVRWYPAKTYIGRNLRPAFRRMLEKDMHTILQLLQDLKNASC